MIKDSIHKGWKNNNIEQDDQGPHPQRVKHNNNHVEHCSQGSCSHTCRVA